MMGQLTNEERDDKVNELQIAVNAAYWINDVLGAMSQDDKGRGPISDGLDIILERCVTLANEVGL